MLLAAFLDDEKDARWGFDGVIMGKSIDFFLYFIKIYIWCTIENINSEIFQPWPPDDGAGPGVSSGNPKLHPAGITQDNRKI